MEREINEKRNYKFGKSEFLFYFVVTVGYSGKPMAKRREIFDVENGRSRGFYQEMRMEWFDSTTKYRDTEIWRTRTIFL